MNIFGIPIGPHDIIIIIIAIIIIVLQIRSFYGTWKRMNLFSGIFGTKEIDQTYARKLVDGETKGFTVTSSNENPYFLKIQDSINSYVENNRSIDFQLIKDTVDGNCNAVEEDIQTQIPIPLYLGLAGTMMGIIVGIGYMWGSGFLKDLGKADASALTTLLSAVAIAMVCSIIGLAMTTICTWLFKGSKLFTEQRKSEFFSWLQQSLLPEVATSDLQAIQKIAGTLNRFNATFSKHASDFGQTLQQVQGIAGQQKQLAATVQQMAANAVTMAKANADATDRLANNAEILDNFNDYLEGINGYLTKLQEFVNKFDKEEERLHVLETMAAFFEQEKAQIEKREDEMRKVVGGFDVVVKKFTGELRQSIVDENKQLKSIIGQQSIIFKDALDAQTKQAEAASKEMIDKLQEQFKQLPDAVAAINNLRDLPKDINSMMQRIEAANSKLISELKDAVAKMPKGGGAGNGTPIIVSGGNGDENSPAQVYIPKIYKWLLGIAVVLVVIFSGIGAYCNWTASEEAKKQTELISMQKDSTALDYAGTISESVDTTAVLPAEAVGTLDAPLINKKEKKANN